MLICTFKLITHLLIQQSAYLIPIQFQLCNQVTNHKFISSETSVKSQSAWQNHKNSIKTTNDRFTNYIAKIQIKTSKKSTNERFTWSSCNHPITNQQSNYITKSKRKVPTVGDDSTSLGRNFEFFSSKLKHSSKRSSFWNAKPINKHISIQFNQNYFE